MTIIFFIRLYSKLEVDLGAMKGNLNAINGAIQQVNKLIEMSTEKKKK